MRAGSLPNGTEVGRFVIESLIGVGGMGEVYAARDTQLARTVALKILPASRATEPDRVERFLREARAASSLNHPAIVTIFDSGGETLGSGEVVHFLAMELIEGTTLAEWTRGRRNREKILDVLAQVAEGLARAHSGGIIHRDLKPDNIMVARGGFAKIVDFGIAKLTERNAAEDAPAGDTAPTAILGTTAFMSPEQVEGRRIDSRSDVFSFGCVMYAAFQGKSPFDRESAVRTMHAIVNEPAPSLSDVPALIERIARRCVAKDPEERYQSIKDVALDLREHMQSPTQLRSRHRICRLLGGLGGAAILAAATWISARASAGRPSSTERIAANQMSMQRLTNSGKIATGALSPDGKYVVYAATEGDRQSLWLRQVATGTDVRMAPPADGFYDNVRVSPDGNYVFYSFCTRVEPNVVDVYRIPILGGEPRKVITDTENGFSIAPDGHRVAFRRFSALTRKSTMHIADVDSGTERLIMTKTFPEGFGMPSWTPDGQRITFIFGSQLNKGRANIVDLDLATNRLTRIATPQWAGFGGISWVPDGSGIVLTAAEQQQPPQLWYLPVGGDAAARKITSDVAFYGGVSFNADSKSFVAHRQEESANVWVVDLVSGRSKALTTGLGSFFGSAGVQWARGREVLYTASGDRGTQIRIMNVDSGESRALSGITGWRPSLSPDKTKIAYIAGNGGIAQLWVADADGSDARLVHEMPVGTNAPPSWLPDGKSLMVMSSGAEQALVVVSVDGKQVRKVHPRPANSPALSPDGQWIVCRLRSIEPNVPLWRTALLRLDGTMEPRFLPVPRGAGPHAFAWLPDSKSFGFIESANGVGNIFVQSIQGGEPRQLTRFDSGRIASFAFSADGQSIVLSKVERVNDLVLIRDFR